MHFESSLSANTNIRDALNEVINGIELDDIDLLVTFFTEPFAPFFDDIADTLQTRLKPRVLLGGSAESIIGTEAEIEQVHGLTVIAARLPEVEIQPFKIEPGDWQFAFEDFVLHLGDPVDPKVFITIADPYSTPVNQYLDAFNAVYPDVPVVGGMASAAREAGENILLMNEYHSSGGVVGVALSGNLDVDVIVSQGCRPIGEPFVVEEAEHNVIIRMSGQPPVQHLQRILTTFPQEERHVLQNGVFLGRAIKANQDNIGRGDFLIRGVVGVDNRYGVMAIGDYIEPGELVQFHVRDALTAEEDLSMMLATQAFYDPPEGVLLFSCNGRGTRLYDHPDGDISVIKQSIGQVEMAGFFAAGEIGPIGGTNFLHGHTASLVLFRSLGQP